MTKKDIRKLAQTSYDSLDEAKIMKIAGLLRRKDLKEYVRQLKSIEKQNEVIVALPDINSYNKSEKIFENIFSNKRIIYQEDTSLLLGTKIIDNDLVYDMTLKNRFEDTTKQVQQTYE